MSCIAREARHLSFAFVFQLIFGFLAICLTDLLLVDLPVCSSATLFYSHRTEMAGTNSERNKPTQLQSSRQQQQQQQHNHHYLQQQSTVPETYMGQFHHRNSSLEFIKLPKIVGILISLERKSLSLQSSDANSTTNLSIRSTNNESIVTDNNIILTGGLGSPPFARNYHRRFPHAIIIGVKKGGTRALLEFLKIHPDVRAKGPESHFFDRNFHRGLEWYRQQMPLTTDNQLTVEKTPSYFITREVPERVLRMSPLTRLIIVVRDPVTRAVSDYAQAVTKRRELPPFDRLAFLQGPGNDTSIRGGQINATWGPIRIGIYVWHLERWLNRFPLRQIHFVSGENLVRNPAGEMKKVERFLGLKPRIGEDDFLLNTTKGFPCIRQSTMEKPRCLGKTKGRTHPNIEPETLHQLAAFFRPFNKKFYDLTGINFGWM